MKKLIWMPLLLLFFGCSQNHFNVPPDDFASKVQVLGVAPIMIDTTSDIKHPQKQELISLFTELNRKYEPQLVRKLKASGNYYTVALLDGDPQQIFSNLFFRREKRNDATIEYNKYFWKTSELRQYMSRNRLDALMAIVVSGISKTDKMSSTTMLSSLTSEYNYLIMTAQIVDADGTILWEYPNFRTRLLSYDPMLVLQYPDFSEAEANKISRANVKFKSLEGIRRILEEKRKDLLRRETQESRVFANQFDEMLDYLDYDVDEEKKKAAEKKAAERDAAKVTAKPTEAAPVPRSEAVAPKAADKPAAETSTPVSPEPVSGKVY